MKLSSDDLHFIATLDECPKIVEAIAKHQEAWRSFRAWLDAVCDAWGVKCDHGFRTLTGNGFIQEVPIKGFRPYYGSKDEAEAAAMTVGHGALAQFDRHAKEWFAHLGLRSEPQKKAASLARDMSIVGTDGSRTIVRFLRDTLPVENEGHGEWLGDPGVFPHGDRLLFTISGRWTGWQKALTNAGAKPATIVEAAQYVLDAERAEVVAA